MSKPNLAAIVLAGGVGSRFHSARPKVIHELLGRPLVGWPVAALRYAGIEDIVVVASPATESALKDAFPEVTVVVQPEPLGTGDAARIGLEGLPDIPDTVIVACGDTPCLTANTFEQLLQRHETQGGGIVVTTAVLEDAGAYGRVVRDESGTHVERIVEARDADADQLSIREINAGLYAFSGKDLQAWMNNLDRDNAQGELYLVDAVAMARAQNKPTGILVIGVEEIQGVNDRGQLAAAAVVLRDRMVQNWQAAGVTFDDPATVWLDPTVALEADTRIGPQVTLKGATRVSGGARIEQGCVLTNTEVGRGAHIRPYVVTSDASIGEDCQVGPFAHLRPGTVLETDVRVGNFVEIKKTRLGRGAKANHLSYLGDADVGAAVNIGAGTITCNYDGRQKHKTRIEDGAFIGSDTQLVAPVTIGRDAVVGAGTTVTHDVTPGALAVSRPQQKEIPDYHRRRKAADKTDL